MPVLLWFGLVLQLGYKCLVYEMKNTDFPDLGLNLGLLNLKSQRLLLDFIVSPLLSVLVLQMLVLQMYLN